jgi:hypothetical protein
MYFLTLILKSLRTKLPSKSSVFSLDPDCAQLMDPDQDCSQSSFTTLKKIPVLFLAETAIGYRIIISRKDGRLRIQKRIMKKVRKNIYPYRYCINITVNLKKMSNAQLYNFLGD